MTGYPVQCPESVVFGAGELRDGGQAPGDQEVSRLAPGLPRRPVETMKKKSQQRLSQKNIL